MPRYYFNIYDDVVCADDDGVELPDVEAARQAAITGARSLMADAILKGHLNLNHRIEVEDEDRRPVLTLPFSAAIALEG